MTVDANLQRHNSQIVLSPAVQNPRAWSFLAVDETERQFGGNLGYEDILGERYIWTKDVGNSRQVQPGDLAVLRDSKSIFGIGWIDEIKVQDGLKIRRRCPRCKSTGFKERRYLRPSFRCFSPECREEFDVPIEEKIEATFFSADYSRTWRPVDQIVPTTGLRTAYLNRAAQQSIRPLAIGQARDLLSLPADIGPRWWADDGGIRPIRGGHGQVLGRRRIGQAQYRDELLARFGSICAITGPQPPEALEAAHLYQFSEKPEHDVHGGLLLRRDLHTLFDRWLLAVDTSNWTVCVAPKLWEFPALADLNGRALEIPRQLRPTSSYLDVHISLSRNAWEGTAAAR